MKRYKHTLSHYRLLTGDMGQLLPVACTEVLPGDTFQHSTSLLVRCSPLATPVMHPVTIRVHHWFVPNRIVWEGWEDFITGESDIGPPTGLSSENQDIRHYLGAPRIAGLDINLLPIYGYNKIYNEFYRDQDLIPEVPDQNYQIQNVSWEKDYFTTARPWTQKGDDVTIPIGDTAPVVTTGVAPTFTVGGYSGTSALRANVSGNFSENLPGLAAWAGREGSEPPAQGSNAIFATTGLEADLSATSAVDVNDLRKAFALQRYQEARARYGSRYTEYLRYCGVRPSDARLQRPELLGGGTTRINFSEVLQTSESSRTTAPQERFGVGDMYGHGIAGMRGNSYRKFFEEHGYIISLMSVRPKAMYDRVTPRHWLKKTKEDYYQKELEHIGQQEVWQNEVRAQGTTVDNQVWGYQDRYREYKAEHSQTMGEFNGVLNSYHLARDLPEDTALNQSFVECNPSKRIYQVQDYHGLWIMAQNNMVARRPVKKSAYSKVL